MWRYFPEKYHKYVVYFHRKLLTEDFPDFDVGKSSRNLLTAEVEFVNKMHTRSPRTEDLGNNILNVIES